jgi:molybdopterin-containing oxidoreductase family membrane subunit
MEVGEDSLLSALLVGRYAPMFWTFALLGTVLPIVLLALPRTRTIRWIVTAAVLVNIGMWLKRFIIVIPSMALPLMPYEWGSYHPTWVEYSITAAAFAAFALVFVLFARIFPVISVWEVAEGWEVDGERRPMEPLVEPATEPLPEPSAAPVPVGAAMAVEAP